MFKTMIVLKSIANVQLFLIFKFLFYFPQVSMLKQWNTKTSASQYGTWVARTKSGLCGDITSRTHKAWFLLLTATTRKDFVKPEMS